MIWEQSKTQNSIRAHNARNNISLTMVHLHSFIKLSQAVIFSEN